MTQTVDGSVRVAEILGALSLFTDLGMGHPAEEAMRACLLATRLARGMNVAEGDLEPIYYTALLRYLGCHGAAHEEAGAFGDDIALRGAGAATDFHDPRDVISFLFTRLGRERPAAQRARMIATAVTSFRKIGEQIESSHCEVAALTADRLQMSSATKESLFHIFERWDGKGPHGLSGESVPLAGRFAILSSTALALERLMGRDGALEGISRMARHKLDPAIVAAFVGSGTDILRSLASEDCAVSLIEEEPGPPRTIDGSQLAEAARAFGDLVDLKSPFLHGHSSGVAAVVAAAVPAYGISGAAAESARIAALLHDLGRTGVPTGIWEKAGPLTTSEWEQVRLHAYHSERILQRSAALAPIASLAGMHQEREDGSGYHRQAKSSSIPPEAKLLAAADVYHALLEDRPHRKKLALEDAAEHMREEARRGRLDADAVAAVLEAAGQGDRPMKREWPAGLSEREVEVLRLVAAGRSNKQIAKELFISDHTVRHHTIHIYQKLGVSTRGGAALFALQNGLFQISF